MQSQNSWAWYTFYVVRINSIINNWTLHWHFDSEEHHMTFICHKNAMLVVNSLDAFQVVTVNLDGLYMITSIWNRIKLTHDVYCMTDFVHKKTKFLEAFVTSLLVVWMYKHCYWQVAKCSRQRKDWLTKYKTINVWLLYETFKFN
jgi:hypothetical protein